MKIIEGIPPELSKGQLVAIDSEFYGQVKGRLHRPHGTFACMSITSDGKTVYQIYDEKEIKDALHAIRNGIWVFHNALYDIRQLRRYATISPRYIHDTMLVDQSMFGGYYVHFSLKDLVRRWLKERMKKEVREEFQATDKMNKEMKQYAAMDAVKTLQVAKLQIKEFYDDPAFKAYTLIDEPMIFPILDMPGVLVDLESWGTMVDEFKVKATELENELEVNVFSKAKVIAGAAKHGVHIRDTKAETLKDYKDNLFIAKVLEARMYRKAVSTYGRKWLEKNVEEDGRVYSGYRITGAETGRMSSAGPNMQQIPARHLPKYREMFPAAKGNVILVADVSQQEPRILAWESRDEELMKAFKSGEDIHLYTARLVYNEPKMKHEDKRRDDGKTLNLGLSYGLSSYGMAVRTGKTEQECAFLIERYFTRFRGVAVWIDLKRAEATKKEYITTASGRKVYMNPYSHSMPNNAINAPIQGGAADFTKMWDRKIWEQCRRMKIPYPVDRIVHDEIVMEVPKTMLKTYEIVIDDAFQETAKTLYSPIPFAMEMKHGATWACKKLAMVEEELGEEEE
jgi:DNA polymerase-1